MGLIFKLPNIRTIMGKYMVKVLISRLDIFMGALFGAVMAISYYQNIDRAKALLSPGMAMFLITIYLAITMVVHDVYLSKKS